MQVSWNTVVSLTGYKEEFEFLYHNHLWGISFARNIAIGGWYNNTLVGVMNVIQINDELVEITRYASGIHNRYQRLFSKTLNCYIKGSGFVGKIVTYFNNNHSNGNLYKSLGFCFEADVNPDYCVIDYKTR